MNGQPEATKCRGSVCSAISFPSVCDFELTIHTGHAVELLLAEDPLHCPVFCERHRTQGDFAVGQLEWVSHDRLMELTMMGFEFAVATLPDRCQVSI